ncbi:MAG: hypothetical protein LC122_02925, partial [Chitinophagales bacterium]|nr:hypothetical protein [Chitinophagales bacterium]
MKKLIKLNIQSIKDKVSAENFLEERFNECIIGITESNNVIYSYIKLFDVFVENINSVYQLEIETGEMSEKKIYKLCEFCTRFLFLEVKNRNAIDPLSPIICTDIVYLGSF